MLSLLTITGHCEEWDTVRHGASVLTIPGHCEAWCECPDYARTLWEMV